MKHLGFTRGKANGIQFSAMMSKVRPISSPDRSPRRKALIVDLNNFSTFPTLAVGLLVAAMRNAGHSVELLSPLANDVPAAERERRETWRDQVMRRVHLSTRPSLRVLRDMARGTRFAWNNRVHPRVIRETRRALQRGPDVLLISSYLQHYKSVRVLAGLAARQGIPVILGGPVFNLPRTADMWRQIPGITAIVGAEADLGLDAIFDAIGDPDALLAIPGVTLPDGRRGPPAPPLRQLDRAPIPDFTDFPWDRYRFPVVPIMTGRGCQWDKCRFCSDVVSVNGRTFRTRSVESVMHEMREQSLRHATTNFLFLDLKLNSHPGMLRGIVENVQRYVPGAEWVGTIHVDQRADNGLSPRELRAAVNAGMRRVSFGLESGSQRMLDTMDKGTTVEANAAFIRQAYEAGLSVRCTAFKGYPGETPEDLLETARFLEEHGKYIDRVRFNDFSIIEETEIYNDLLAMPDRFPMQVTRRDDRNARALYRNPEAYGRPYRKAKARVARAVYAINRKPVRRAAAAFDGLM